MRRPGFSKNCIPTGKERKGKIIKSKLHISCSENIRRVLVAACN
jgi:hypothetical protein